MAALDAADQTRIDNLIIAHDAAKASMLTIIADVGAGVDQSAATIDVLVLTDSLSTFSNNVRFDGTINQNQLVVDGNGIKPQIGSFAAPPGGTGILFGSLTLGQLIGGSGTVNDITIVNKVGSQVLSVPTGTLNVALAGAISVVGSISSGVVPSANESIRMKRTGSANNFWTIECATGIPRIDWLTTANRFSFSQQGGSMLMFDETGGATLMVIRSVANGKTVTIGGGLRVDDTSESSSTTTGSGQFDGGVGIAGNVNSGGYLRGRPFIQGDLSGSATLNADNNRNAIRRFTGATLHNVTISDTAGTWVNGDTLTLTQIGAGQVALLAGGVGFVFRVPANRAAKTRTQFSTITMQAVSATEFVIGGDLEVI